MWQNKMNGKWSGNCNSGKKEEIGLKENEKSWVNSEMKGDKGKI